MKTAVSPRSSPLGTETSASDDLKTVRNPAEALIGRQSSYIAIVYERQTKDKRPERSNI